MDTNSAITANLIKRTQKREIKREAIKFYEHKRRTIFLDFTTVAIQARPLNYFNVITLVQRGHNHQKSETNHRTTTWKRFKLHV
ncbi:hypothetical protein PoB_002115700 [Plakobranchus ocellatus]|uniref:Uncharacterized protein n=1 Tax=Plakobranchus ocellatus TaxID=259542 RepID=A0AAV3ZH45_9GAST|nr:hypothetical protein PoB_002115700 [Plakobranchus ocellatus]